MKKSKIFSLVTAFLVTLSVSVTAMVSSAAEMKSFELKSQAGPVKAHLTWKFDAPPADFTNYAKTEMSLNIYNAGYTYTNVKIDGKNFNNNTSATVTYGNRSDVSVNNQAQTLVLPVDKGFKVTADVAQNYNSLVSKNDWQTYISYNDLNAVLRINRSSGSYGTPPNQTVTPTVVADTGKVSTFTSDPDFFDGRSFVNGVTLFTDEQKQNILKAVYIDISFELSRETDAPVGLKLYLSDSNILNPNDVSRVFSGTANRYTRTITFSNVKLTPAGNTTAFFNNYVLAADTAYSVLDKIKVTNVTVTFPDSSLVNYTSPYTSVTPNNPEPALPQPPFVPNSVAQNVRATRYATTIDVRWDAITSAQYGIYYIYFDSKGAPGNWTVKAVNTNTYTIPTPVSGATYYITVLPFTDTPSRQYGGFSPYTIVKT